MIEGIVKILAKGSDLSSEQMRQAMDEIMSGQAQTPQIVLFLTGLSKKGETVEELTAAVEVMRRHLTKIETKEKVVLDTCGTGGDKTGTFNISTCAAFVVSGSGVVVAKHGNRSVSSSCGSADILEYLGININMGKAKIEKCLNEIGIAFLFAQGLHPAMKYAMPARKEIGRRTIFNLLGPLSNPASAKHQLIGVYERRWVEVLANALANLGTLHALVVHGDDGLDEITTTAKTSISELLKGKIKNYEVSPEDFGFKRSSLADLKGGDLRENGEILIDILRGGLSFKRDIVLLNAGSAIYAADKAVSIIEGIELAKRSIDSGNAYKKFELLREYSLQN